MSALQVFSANGWTVRTVTVGGEPWFVASDVCRALDLSDTSKTVSLLDGDERGTNTVLTPGGEQQVLVISEAGLYSLVLRSRKPEAKAFKRWVTHEVLPEIRRTGTYTAPTVPVTEASPLALARLMLGELEDQQRRLAEVEATTRVLEFEHAEDRMLVEQIHAKVDRRDPADPQLEPITVTTIGSLLVPARSGVAVNRLLQELGLQWHQDGRWVPTHEGRPYAVAMPVQHASGRWHEHLHWQRRIVPVIERRLARRRALSGGVS